MIPATSFAGRSVALFGLGGSGLATALALRAGGARVVACDDDPARMAVAGSKGIETADLRRADWSTFAALVLSPGVPLTHPEPHWSARLAQAAGIEIIGDIELFCRERARIAPDAPFVAITGTNGKSTTTALIAHILRSDGRDVQLGGNIGTAILSLDPPAADRFHVIECSSFQIDLAPSLAPTIGVQLNVSPDHLDRHGTLALYAAIKERLVAASGTAVVGVDDEASRAMAARVTRAGRRLVPIGLSGEGPGVFAHEGAIVSGLDGPAYEVASVTNIASLRGDHNAQNAAAAVAVALLCGVSAPVIQEALRSFPGLPHRMEEIARLGQTLFINDSKATNANSTEKALRSFDNILWILGGKAKEGGITELRPYFPKIAKAYLIGAASEMFAETLAGAVPFALCASLDRAVAQAAEEARGMAEAVVLLSPACASYDQYPNYEVRGEHFRELVRALPGINPTMGA